MIYIAWEGRGYTSESLRKDVQVVEEYLKPQGSVYYCLYDVGILVSDTNTPDFNGKVSETRHGEISDMFADTVFYNENPRWDEDLLEEIQNPANWTKCASIKEMVGDWFMNEFMDACD